MSCVAFFEVTVQKRRKKTCKILPPQFATCYVNQLKAYFKHFATEKFAHHEACSILHTSLTTEEPSMSMTENFEKEEILRKNSANSIKRADVSATVVTLLDSVTLATASRRLRQRRTVDRSLKRPPASVSTSKRRNKRESNE